MTSEFYKKTFETMLKEFNSLSARRILLEREIEQIDGRLDAVRQAALGVIPLTGNSVQEIKEQYPDLFEDQPDPRVGITLAVSEALITSDDLMTPTEIRDKVFKISPVIAGQKNPLASIHTVIRRLIERGKVIEAVKNGATAFGWIDSPDWLIRLRRWIPSERLAAVVKEVARMREKRKKE